MFEGLLARRADPGAEAARDLYRAVVEQSRDPAFYRDGGVPDSLDGRFELIVLHSFLVMRRLKAEGSAGVELSQKLFDVLFQNLDENLREMGVGDMGIGKRIKKMGKAFYVRVSAYEAGLEDGPSSLAEALGRNLLGTVESSGAQREALARYVEACDRGLRGQDLSLLSAGKAAFAAFPVEAEADG